MVTRRPKKPANPAGRPPGRPKGSAEENFQERRLEILRTAARAFTERGFHATSLNDLAALLDVTKPSIYYYVQSKDELLFECGRLALERLTEAMKRAVTSDENALERLRAFFLNYAEIICDDFGRCLVLTDPQWLEPDNRKLNVHGRRELTQEIQNIIAKGISEGSIRPCNPRIAAFTLFSAFNGIARWYRPDGGMKPAELARETLNLLVNGLGTAKTVEAEFV